MCVCLFCVVKQENVYDSHTFKVTSFEDRESFCLSPMAGQLALDWLGEENNVLGETVELFSSVK